MLPGIAALPVAGKLIANGSHKSAVLEIKKNDALDGPISGADIDCSVINKPFYGGLCPDGKAVKKEMIRIYDDSNRPLKASIKVRCLQK